GTDQGGARDGYPARSRSRGRRWAACDRHGAPWGASDRPPALRTLRPPGRSRNVRGDRITRGRVGPQLRRSLAATGALLYGAGWFGAVADRPLRFRSRPARGGTPARADAKRSAPHG